MVVMKRFKTGMLFLVLLFLSTGCTKEAGILAVVSGERITAEDLEQEKAFYQAIYGEMLPSDRELLDALVYEKMVELDPLTKEGDVTAEQEKLRKQISENLGGETFLSDQLDGFRLTKAQFDQSVSIQAKTMAHQNAFRKLNPFTEEDLRAFFRKEKEKAYLVSFYDILLPTKTGVEEMAEDLSKNPEKLMEAVDQVESDDFSYTTATFVEKADYSITEIYPEELFTMAYPDALTFYADGKYHMVFLKEREESFDALKDVLGERYFEQTYGAYLKEKAKDFEVKIYFSE